jgi:hypothetical protein
MEKEDNYINKEIKESSHKEEKPKKQKRESFMSEILEMFGD